MRIAIVGSGISGMLAARLLLQDHELTVYEARDRIGGHTHTVDVPGGPAVDTGFIVFNRVTYPGFCRMLELLGVPSQASDMSFSVRSERSGVEYNPTNLNTIFAQRMNLLRPSFYRMFRDIIRFLGDAKRFLEDPDPALTLGDFLRAGRYGQRCVDEHVIPLGSAIWSADPARMADMPFLFYARFFENHGFLEVSDRIPWRVIEGGSRRYAEKLIEPFRDRIRTGCPVRSVRRDAGGVELRTDAFGPERYDKVVLAVHSDQALRMLADPSPAEREILGAIAFQPNDTVLHTDVSLMPRTRRAWASWNGYLPATPHSRCSVTYDMNRLQSLPTAERYLVTLNRTGAIDPARSILQQTYHHPIFEPASVAAQKRHNEIDGVRNTHFCGAWWGYGFHEDGVQSALAVAARFGRGIEACRAACTQVA